MTLDPREIHVLDQLGALTREVARELAAYRKELEDGGMSKAEAWALTQRLEERLLGPTYDDLADIRRAIRKALGDG